MQEFIDWEKFPVPEDVKGIFIKYEDGYIGCDRYDHETKKRKYRDSKIVGWKFMERTSQKSIQCKTEMNLNEQDHFRDATKMISA